MLDPPHPPDACARRSRHRRRRGEAGARRARAPAPRRSVPVRPRRGAGADFGLRVEPRRRRSTLLRAGRQDRVRRLRGAAAPHAGPLPRRRLPGSGAVRASAGQGSLRRRHAVCRVDRPHRPARRRLCDAHRVNPLRAVCVRRRRPRVSRPRAGYDHRPGAENQPVPSGASERLQALGWLWALLPSASVRSCDSGFVFRAPRILLPCAFLRPHSCSCPFSPTVPRPVRLVRPSAGRRE